MNLLIITQIVDIDHSVLGFFHTWIKKFSEQYEQIIVSLTIWRSVEVFYNSGVDMNKSRLTVLSKYLADLVNFLTMVNNGIYFVYKIK